MQHVHYSLNRNTHKTKRFCVSCFWACAFVVTTQSNKRVEMRQLLSLKVTRKKILLLNKEHFQFTTINYFSYFACFVLQRLKGRMPRYG